MLVDSQTECETLSGVWGYERFQLFLLGVKVELFTNHKALLQIYWRTSKLSARIKRCVLRLQLFDFVIEYKKGAENPPDALSRFSIRNEIEKSYSVTNEYVNFITQRRSESVDIDEIRHETQMEDTLNLVIKTLKDNSWPKNSPSLHPFQKFYKNYVSKTIFF